MLRRTVILVKSWKSIYMPSVYAPAVCLSYKYILALHFPAQREIRILELLGQ